VRDNLLVMALGLHCLEEYAAQPRRSTLPELDVGDRGGRHARGHPRGRWPGEERLRLLPRGAVGDGHQPALSSTASTTSMHEGLLALHFPVCHAAFCRALPAHGLRGRGARPQGACAASWWRRSCAVTYVQRARRAGLLRRPRGDRRRAVLVDLDAGQEAARGGGFPRLPEPEVERGYRGGWQRD
jgi:hypothetical protein